jgi:two-component system LytT family response regulator
MNEVLNLALCDDEKHIHEAVSEMLQEYAQEMQCEWNILHLYSAKELLDAKEEIPILLLDIDMPGMDGIEAAIHLMESGRESKIIMLTSKQERFKEAFKIGAYRFVTKPIDGDELYEALNDVRRTLIGYDEVQLKLEHVLCRIRQRNIDYLEANGDYVKIYVSKKICESDKALKSWKEELDDRLFAECHKSYIVNLDRVNCVKTRSLILEDGTEIPIARRRRNDVLQALMAYDASK